MTNTERVANRLVAIATGAALALGMLSATVGGALASTNLDCPGMRVRLERAFPDHLGRLGFGVDDDVLITLNGAVLVDDHDGQAQEFSAIEFPVHTGDQLHIVATNSPDYGFSNAFISTLALFCTSNSNVQILEGAEYNPANIGPGVEFFNRTYTVILQEPPAYSFGGFKQPVDSLPTVNQMKAGGAVPVKFSLAGNQGLGIFADGYPKSQSIACNSTASVDGIEETVSAGGSSLSYDAASDTYSYIWKTDKAWAGTCRQLVLKLTDGASYRANFQFK
jgi:hypothetical protein